MTITPGELLETSIAQLRTLVAFLGEQLDGSAGGDTPQSSTLEVRACKGMLVSLTLLLQGEGLANGAMELPPRQQNAQGSLSALPRPSPELASGSATSDFTIAPHQLRP